MHWARKYVGKPWAADGNGPARFSCWGLVRCVFLTRHGVQFPAVAVGSDQPSPENVTAIKQAARASGMRPLPASAAADGDIVLMRSLGRLHCGYVIEDMGRAKVLHSSHERGVVCEPWADATEGMEVELWRRQA